LYADAYARELSRQILARSAALYISEEAQDVWEATSVIGTSVDLVPFFTLLGLIGIYV